MEGKKNGRVKWWNIISKNKKKNIKNKTLLFKKQAAFFLSVVFFGNQEGYSEGNFDFLNL